MVRRPNPQKSADMTFRVRVKFATSGSGTRGMTAIHSWLRARVGEKGFGIYPVMFFPHPDAFAVHLNDAALVPELVQVIEDIMNERIPYSVRSDAMGKTRDDTSED